MPPCLVSYAIRSETPERRFPPPWDIEEANASCFIVKDNNGQALAFEYFEQDPTGCQFAHPRRGPPDRGQYCEAAGAAERPQY